MALDHPNTLVPHPLSKRAHRAWCDLASAAVPAGDRLDIPVDPEMVAEKVGLTLASVGVEGRFGVKLALHAFEWLALLRYGRPFTRLDPERQGRFLYSWTESRLLILRLAARLLLTIIKPVHLSQRAVKVRLGLPVDQFANVAPEKIVKVGNAALEGATIMLVSRKMRRKAEEMARLIEHLELETTSDFFDIFVEGCMFNPMRLEIA